MVCVRESLGCSGGGEGEVAQEDSGGGGEGRRG